MSGTESRISPVAIDREYSRRNFLKTAAWTGAAISAMGIGGFGVAVRRAEAQAQAYKTYQGLGDAAILQFAYQLELLEGNFYAAGVEAGLFKDAFLEQVIAIRDHEMAHADAIAATLGDLGEEVPAEPNLIFPEDATANPENFLGYAATLEPVGIGAYQGAAPALKSKDILAAAISIHNAECQHRCAINIMNLVQPPNDLAFEEALPLEAVQKAVKPFGITG
jgi:hypothetical protein